MRSGCVCGRGDRLRWDWLWRWIPAEDAGMTGDWEGDAGMRGMCPLCQADVSSFWPDVSTFRPNVSSLVGHVSSYGRRSRGAQNFRVTRT